MYNVINAIMFLVILSSGLICHKIVYQNKYFYFKNFMDFSVVNSVNMC